MSGASGTTNVTGTVVVGSISDVGKVHNAGTLAAGANNIGDVDIATGTVTLLSTVTTVSNLTNGSVNILTGTVTALAVGTIGGKAASGAAAVANPVQIAGTDSGGTIYSPIVTTGGVLSAVMPTGTVTTIAAGTQNTLGTVSNLINGSIRITFGTLTTGSLTNLASLHTGTIQSVSEVVKGTTTLVSTVTTVSNLTNGSVNLLTGTVTSVSNLAAGTVQINPDPVPTMLLFGTQGTAGGSFFATISAASGAGTKHFISGVDVVVESGTADARVLTGTAIQGTGVLGAGKFPPGGGISKVFTPAFETGTNSEITYHFVGAGTAFIHVSYWKGT